MLGPPADRDFGRLTLSQRGSLVKAVPEKGTIPMASSVFDLLLHAANNGQQIICTYHGFRREICPHVVGWGLAGQEMALAYQFAGESSKGLPVGGEWRCFRLGSVKDAIARPGAWHTGQSHLKPQTCVQRIEFEVRS